jgi:hypothetical protein
VIWLFLRFALSCYELEELLAKVDPGAPRGHLVLGPFQSRDYMPVANSAFEASGRWHLAEMVASITGKQMYL